MKIIEPKVELIEQGEDIVSHVARCARVCYKREKGNDEVTYNNLLKNKHWSMFRHATYYFIIPKDYQPSWITEIYIVININKQYVIGIDVKADNNNYYIVTNGNWNLDHQDLLYTILSYQIEDKVFANANEIAWNMMRYTFKVTTQISTSRELNRVSPNNIAEQSSRYVYEDGTICRPHWMTEDDVTNYHEGRIYELNKRAINYFRSSAHSFKHYKELVDDDLHRQDARGVLPLDTATECVYTYSIAEWCHIIELRGDSRAHPNANIIANLIKEKLNELSYDI